MGVCVCVGGVTFWSGSEIRRESARTIDLRLHRKKNTLSLKFHIAEKNTFRKRCGLGRKVCLIHKWTPNTSAHAAYTESFHCLRATRPETVVSAQRQGDAIGLEVLDLINF